jgi:hypothetical protein
MPKVVGLSLLQDRVFHVLVVTARTYHADDPSVLSQSYTIQLPVDYESLDDVAIIRQRSHIKALGSSRCYHVPSDAGSPLSQPSALQKKRQGRKLTEGTYVSLERLLRAPKTVSVDDNTRQRAEPGNDDYHHRWDMVSFYGGSICDMCTKYR